MEKGNLEAAEQVEAVAIAEAAEKTTLTDRVLNQAALEGTADEHELDVPAALRAYPKALGWALVSATCVIMEGYDTNLLHVYPSLWRLFAFSDHLMSGPDGLKHSSD